MHLSEFALTHMSYEKHISEKNELKERESVVAAAVLWEMSWKNDQGSVFYHHGCQNSEMEMFFWWKEYGNKNTKSGIYGLENSIKKFLEEKKCAKDMQCSMPPKHIF